MSFPETFWVAVVGSLVFGVMGITLLLAGFKLFDWILPKVDFQEALKNADGKQNPVAWGIIIAGFFLAVAHIIASVVH